MERKEAIEIVRKLYNESLFMKKDMEAMVTLIPELKESEDESIRKAMIKYFTNGKEYLSLTPYSREDYIAWLEKQGENAKFRDSIQVGDKVTRNQDGVLVNLSQLNRVVKKDEKQDEQKHTTKEYIDEAGVVLLQLRENVESLEVKEVDLKTMFREYINKTYTDEHSRHILDGSTTKIDSSDLYGAMCHGFELGLKASNPLTWEDISVIRQTMAEYRREENHERNNEDFCKEVLKRFKAKKGE